MDLRFSLHVAGDPACELDFILPVIHLPRRSWRFTGLTPQLHGEHERAAAEFVILIECTKGTRRSNRCIVYVALGWDRTDSMTNSQVRLMRTAKKRAQAVARRTSHENYRRPTRGPYHIASEAT